MPVSLLHISMFAWIQVINVIGNITFNMYYISINIFATIVLCVWSEREFYLYIYLTDICLYYVSHEKYHLEIMHRPSTYQALYTFSSTSKNENDLRMEKDNYYNYKYYILSKNSKSHTWIILEYHPKAHELESVQSSASILKFSHYKDRNLNLLFHVWQIVVLNVNYSVHVCQSISHISLCHLSNLSINLTMKRDRETEI